MRRRLNKLSVFTWESAGSPRPFQVVAPKLTNLSFSRVSVLSNQISLRPPNPRSDEPFLTRPVRTTGRVLSFRPDNAWAGGVTVGGSLNGLLPLKCSGVGQMWVPKND